MTQRLPTAEHVLEVGIRRAVWMIRAGRPSEAQAALLVAGYTAELIQGDADQTAYLERLTP